MAIKVAINGFGRIGRLVFRSIVERNLLGSEIEVVAINDLVSAENLAYLLKYDSVHGRFPGKIDTRGDDGIVINDIGIPCFAIKEGPAHMPWRKLEADIVIESTGFFTSKTQLDGHLKAGAKKVILTAPGKDDIKTVVIGVNEDTLTARDVLISNASCTTNCLAPLAMIMDEQFGIQEGFMTTIHSYTASQKSVDGPSKSDWRDGRSAATNIIPSSTGAARAVALVLPNLYGKMTGMAFRVPTPNVSVVDFTVRVEKSTNFDEICAVLKAASAGRLKGILGYTEEPVVSSDFIRNTASSVFDASSSLELNEYFYKLVSWYDNEWGYSNRCVDLIEHLKQFL